MLAAGGWANAGVSNTNAAPRVTIVRAVMITSPVEDTVESLGSLLDRRDVRRGREVWRVQKSHRRGTVPDFPFLPGSYERTEGGESRKKRVPDQPEAPARE